PARRAPRRPPRAPARLGPRARELPDLRRPQGPLRRPRQAAELPAAAGRHPLPGGARAPARRGAPRPPRPRSGRALCDRPPRPPGRAALRPPGAADGLRALRLADPLRHGLPLAPQLARARALLPPRPARRL